MIEELSQTITETNEKLKIINENNLKLFSKNISVKQNCHILENQISALEKENAQLKLIVDLQKGNVSFSIFFK